MGVMDSARDILVGLRDGKPGLSGRITLKLFLGLEVGLDSADVQIISRGLLLRTR
jgi:hypothetical protein